MTAAAGAICARRRPALLLLLAVAGLASATGCRDGGRRAAPPPTDVATVVADAARSAAPADAAATEAAPGQPLVVQGEAVPPVFGTLEACAGRCSLARLEQAPRPEGEVGPGTLLYAGDLLESPGEGGAEVRLASGARLVLWPGTRVKLGLPRPGDLGLATGGVAVVDAAPDGSAAGALRLHTPVGTIGPLGGRFAARTAAGGGGLLFGAPDDAPAAPPLALADGLGPELPLARGVLHGLGPAAAAAGSETLAWAAGTPVPAATVDAAHATFEAQAAGAGDPRGRVVVALAQALRPGVEALEAAREENRSLLAQLEAAGGDAPAVRDALRASAARSVEAERTLTVVWYRLELLVGAAAAGEQWAAHAARGMERWRAQVEALLRSPAAAVH